MERWKSRGRKSQRGEEKKWEDQRGEKVRRKKMQVREKVGKSRFTVFLQWFVAPEGRKVTSLKRRVRSHLARWEMKSCTPLWREAHFQVKSVKKLMGSDHFGKMRCRTSLRRCGAKQIEGASARVPPTPIFMVFSYGTGNEDHAKWEGWAMLCRNRCRFRASRKRKTWPTAASLAAAVWHKKRNHLA